MRSLDEIIAASRTRLERAWSHHSQLIKDKIRARVGEKAIARDVGEFDDDDFEDELADLVDDMLAEKPYIDAAKAGAAAVPDVGDRGIDPHALGRAQAEYRRKYAEAVPARISGNLAAWLNESAPDYDADTDAFWAAVDDKIAAIGTDVTRYADPPWSSGMSGYGNQLGAMDVQLVWTLDDEAEHCEDCPALAAGSPYTIEAIPTWPAQGDTECLDHCRCVITADPQSWADAFGEQAA